MYVLLLIKGKLPNSGHRQLFPESIIELNVIMTHRQRHEISVRSDGDPFTRIRSEYILKGIYAPCPSVLVRFTTWKNDTPPVTIIGP